MPGTYAHLTLIDSATRKIDHLPPEIQHAYLSFKQFCLFGAVSPDFPYLALGHKEQQAWADKMHYIKTVSMISEGMKLLKELSGDEQLTGLAWLMGYAAHVVMDVTVHPIVELKVGKYAENKTAHRRCELHQDAHVFKRLNMGEIGQPESLRPIVYDCCNEAEELSPIVVSLWDAMLARCHPDQYAIARPNIILWHHEFKDKLDELAEEGHQLWSLARHVLVEDLAVAYPNTDEINLEYIENLQTPNGPQHYDAIFSKALDNVIVMWGHLREGTFGYNDNVLASLGEWDLDTGRLVPSPLVYWS
ncbi:MAG: zinc dependent phospholipase C family protein [Thermodesulfobacteriota bacterium]